jgi:ABC-type phosphate transport system substrate-binding protein
MKSRHLLVLLLAIAALPVTAADWVLVANPKAGIARLSQDEVADIFLGRYRRLASGVTAEPIDQPADSALRARFYRNLVDKNPAEINAYWARLVFSGNTHPPRVVANSDEALQWVARRPGALGYVERSKVDARVMVVFETTE